LLKPHFLHGLNAAIVAKVGAFSRLNPAHGIQWMEWNGSFEAKEKIILDEGEYEQELCSFASQARGIPDLKVPAGGPFLDRLRRWWYYRRLARGERNGAAAPA